MGQSIRGWQERYVESLPQRELEKVKEASCQPVPSLGFSKILSPFPPRRFLDLRFSSYWLKTISGICNWPGLKVLKEDLGGSGQVMGGCSLSFGNQLPARMPAIRQRPIAIGDGASAAMAAGPGSRV